MDGFLFNDIIFGPVKSRRLGVSLGINLLPTNYKYCSFNCIYCECGWNQRPPKDALKLPTREEVSIALEKKLKELHANRNVPDAITFAGNGEPTIHPEFHAIVDDTIRLRNTFFPDTAVSVLSNASMLHRQEIHTALQKVDMNILKLDAGTEATFRLINQPPSHLGFTQLLDQIKGLGPNVILQSIFLRGEYNGQRVDNTQPEELKAWQECLKIINPQYVMVYTIDRATPEDSLQKIGFEELLAIGRLAEEAGVPAKVYG